MLERRIYQIEDYLNDEICERLKKSGEDRDISRKLKPHVMQIALAVFGDF